MSDSIVAGFVFGILGSALLVWGKKRANLAHIGIAVVLLAYPYFVSDAWLLWGLGLALLVLAYFTR